jgi:HSP20 family protein
MLVRYNPWQEMNALQRQLNRLFEDTKVPFNSLEKGFVRVPAAELNDTAEAIHLKLELPGMEAKDLEVQVTKNAVYVSGERKAETKTEEKGMTRSEFRYGKFQRVIPLPAEIENNNVTAEYKDGILNLTMPKTQQEQNKVVKVNLEPTAA